jgi:hypothetical protein
MCYRSLANRGRSDSYNCIDNLSFVMQSILSNYINTNANIAYDETVVICHMSLNQKSYQNTVDTYLSYLNYLNLSYLYRIALHQVICIFLFLL